MKHDAWGMAAGLGMAGMVFSVWVACSSSSNSPSAADAGNENKTDAGEAGGFCSGPASGTLIDDMSGSSISLKPPTCATKGNWHASSSGTRTVPSGNRYSPLPAGFPGPTTTADSGAPAAQAMCIAGQTGTSQYAISELQLVLAWSGKIPPYVLIDASGYVGIQFWLWVSPDTAASVGSSLFVGLVDENQTPGGGVCDSGATGFSACGYAAAVVSSSLAQNNDLGRLFADGGSVLNALSGGWQHVWAPWSSFIASPWWGGANETTVDPRTLSQVLFFIQNESTSGVGVPFDFCIYDLSFIAKSDLPELMDDGTYCTGPATEALIDDMSGSSISLTPPSCGTKGSTHLQSKRRRFQRNRSY